MENTDKKNSFGSRELFLDASKLEHVYKGDFKPADWAKRHHAIGRPINNKAFLHTFEWDQKPHEELVDATLTARGEKNNNGHGPVNDIIEIVRDGGTDIMHEKLYPDGSSQFSKEWTLPKTILNICNVSHSLSIKIEDDSTVNLLTLSLKFEHKH